jgi:hypothetical protein
MLQKSRAKKRAASEYLTAKRSFYGFGARKTYLLVQYLIPRVPQCQSPRPNWDHPTPSPASECIPHPGTKGGGDTLACG